MTHRRSSPTSKPPSSGSDSSTSPPTPSRGSRERQLAMRHRQYLVLPVPDCPCMAVHHTCHRLSPDQVTSCYMAANNRGRLDPPVPPEYFGNMVTPLRTAVTIGELLDRGTGWAARQLHATVAEHNAVMLRKWNEEWINSQHMYHLGRMFDPCNVMMWSSPRFNMYGNEFGLGKAVALRSG
ncbi:hypothetical protein NL676_024915 [Syzygium grande]|nr:hypothetical protein NL676_024915 [Syzygium grande]